jgi:hypothetical protein
MVKKIKNIATKAIRPIPDRRTAVFRPRFLRLKMKMPVTERSAIKTKSAEKGI